MQEPEPPQVPSSRPNLLSASRPGVDEQQQILARLERKAAEQARMMGVARKSLRVAGTTLAGIGVVVALLVFIKHQNAGQKPIVPMVVATQEKLPAAPPTPLPALLVDASTERLFSAPAQAASALTIVEKEETPVAPVPETIVRIVASKVTSKVMATRKPKAKAPKVLAGNRQAAATRKPPLVALNNPKKLLVVAKAAPQPIDTDVSLLSAILLHSSRPAVVPPAVHRPPCTKAPQPPCGNHAPDPQ